MNRKKKQKIKHLSRVEEGSGDEGEGTGATKTEEHGIVLSFNSFLFALCSSFLSFLSSPPLHTTPFSFPFPLFLILPTSSHHSSSSLVIPHLSYLFLIIPSLIPHLFHPSNSPTFPLPISTIPLILRPLPLSTHSPHSSPPFPSSHFHIPSFSVPSPHFHPLPFPPFPSFSVPPHFIPLISLPPISILSHFHHSLNSPRPLPISTIPSFSIPPPISILSHLPSPFPSLFHHSPPISILPISIPHSRSPFSVSHLALVFLSPSPRPPLRKASLEVTLIFHCNSTHYSTRAASRPGTVPPKPRRSSEHTPTFSTFSSPETKLPPSFLASPKASPSSPGPSAAMTTTVTTGVLAGTAGGAGLAGLAVAGAGASLRGRRRGLEDAERPRVGASGGRDRMRHEAEQQHVMRTLSLLLLVVAVAYAVSRLRGARAKATTGPFAWSWLALGL
ncbi:hypothetical protein C7M84_024950 [Penaeus vannamei]|uniref:Uncharacterized protein n=1 Tax=Penaeus vannamei TaxID=6689 RepID=A0A3R7PCJ2_PENVA|nr:hypothetical protein C7M84_024950 [Penaeus vannamei]